MLFTAIKGVPCSGFKGGGVKGFCVTWWGIIEDISRSPTAFTPPWVSGNKFPVEVGGWDLICNLLQLHLRYEKTVLSIL